MGVCNFQGQGKTICPLKVRGLAAQFQKHGWGLRNLFVSSEENTRMGLGFFLHLEMRLMWASKLYRFCKKAFFSLSSWLSQYSHTNRGLEYFCYSLIFHHQTSSTWCFWHLQLPKIVLTHTSLDQLCVDFHSYRQTTIFSWLILSYILVISYWLYRLSQWYCSYRDQESSSPCLTSNRLAVVLCLFCMMVL